MKFYAPHPASKGGTRARPAFIDGPEFALFLNGLPDATAFLELDGRIRLVNVAFERLLATGRAGLLGTDLTRHGRNGEDLLLGAATALARLQRFEGRGAIAGQPNTRAMLQVLRSGEGTPYGALLVLTPPERGTAPLGGTFRFLTEQNPPDAGPVLSPAHASAEARALRALTQASPLLVTGETGTGKTAFIRRIAGADPDRPLVHVACTSLTEANFTAEMQGQDHAPGGRRAGLIEAASGGTLCLDHVEDLTLPLQARLLALLDADSFRPFADGGTVRLVTATVVDLSALVAKGAFRADLFHRIAAVRVTLPALRDEPDMIPALTQRIMARINLHRHPPLSLSPAFTQLLLGHDYPGNIRELENILAHAATTSGAQATAEDFTTPPRPAAMARPAGTDLRSQVQAFEEGLIADALASHRSKRSAAKALGIDVATLIRKTGRARHSTPNKE
ncbi:sigma 54-interacting transcriptional regulator [Paracoccus litorisediminis]|uniref:HTH-type transcriptional regulatory protein TyrR n=1 Tax=Paracoccus litorisediminis TaxID=2006130 RepID=A0A844HWM0_9RHOB|nr:sigma 54-interacting transcriptional regulator [Paracoccus litorisediminis]MTH61911.1 AAA domain-containing protein [Paracoccus litorisediminis]